ncbi:MAG: membrane dipeptidase [Planctomycetota bacterium]
MPHNWFDAHLDLACIALEGRDMHSADLATCAGANPPAAITLPSLVEGRVRSMLATIFIEPDGSPAAIAYKSGDADSAHAAGLRQLELYKDWERRGLIAIVRPGAMPTKPAETTIETRILIEGADCIQSPDEAWWWRDQGVAAVSLAWAKQTRYAGGNGCETGLTDLGRTMVGELDRLGIVHDTTHLSDASLAQLFDLTDKPVIASHSNCRAIVDDGSLTGPLALGMRQRHLTDASIREIARRGGMIGSVLYSPFIIKGGLRDRRATLTEWAAHVDHQCDLMQTRRQIGLGSDADGGFSAACMPDGINRPADYKKLLETLSQRGWTDPEIEGFAWGNWTRFWNER